MTSHRLYRAAQLYNRCGRQGVFNCGKTFFHEEIEPQLEKVRLGKRGLPSVRFAILATGAGRAALTLSCGRKTRRRTVFVDERLRRFAVKPPTRRTGACRLAAVPLDVLGERPGRARSVRLKLVR